MKYSELIDFQPIEDVIQLKSADDKFKSREYVKSYVMSDKMAATLKAAIVDQLRFDVRESKGILVVGNYGTGKSHLMSVISAVANDADYLPLLKNRNFAASIEPVAGKFEVLRLEIGGGVTIPLREIIFAAIREDFGKRGIFIDAPNFNAVWNNKNLIRDTMNAFERKYPARGYFLVVDEFFSYLSSRDERQIIRDLEFLRDLSEMCAKSKLRIIFGVQEKVFDNPRFSFVSDTLRHVSDRFTQVIITKDATSYVVAERILKKSPAQKDWIRRHLEKFCGLYSGMASRLDEFVELFPIHPAYIDVFNKIWLIENRHVLKNISLAIKNVFDTEVPPDAPGIISFDDYWKAIKSDIFPKNQETILRVVEASSTLEEIVNRSFRKPAYKPLAIKIIYALSVHRLTTNGLDARFGLTAENLKDDLCLYLPLPEHDANFLLGIIRATLEEILHTVSGQFIVRNEDNGQFYIDVNKTVDYDEKIRQKASLAAPDDLNRYFYRLVLDAVTWDKQPYVEGFKIYEHDLIWHSHKIFREGYLFLGLPEDRSTAQPERDFYMHVMPPFGEDYRLAATPEDEVYFYFAPDEDFKKNLAHCAAARELERMSDGKDRTAYHGKADDLHRNLIRALGEKKTAAFNVCYVGKRRRLLEIVRGYSRPDDTFGDTLDLAAALCLENYFKKIYPDFPVMETRITRKNAIELTRETYKHFAGKKTIHSAEILRSFKILDGDKIRPENSPFAKYFIDRVKNLPPQGVLNYSDLFEERGAWKVDKKFKIPFNLTPIIFLAMVYGGFAEITFDNDSKLTAANLEQRLQENDIAFNLHEFKYLSRPAKLPLDSLIKLFKILSLNPALIQADKESAVEKLLERAQTLSNDAARAEVTLSRSFELWGEPLATSEKIREMKAACEKIRNEFGNYRVRFNTPAKLKNFSLADAQLDALAENLKRLNFVKEFVDFKAGCLEAVTYVAAIERVDAINADLAEVKRFFRVKRQGILSDRKGSTAAQKVCEEIAKFKARYIELYLRRHEENRLNRDESARRGSIISGKIFSNLRTLDAVKIFSNAKFSELKNEIADLQICTELTPDDLERHPICTHCGYHLSERGSDVHEKFDSLEQRPLELLREWEKILLDTLNDPLIQSNMRFLNERQQRTIQNFLSDKKLPDYVDAFFVESIKTLMKHYSPVIIDAETLIRELESLPPLDETSFRKKLDSIIKAYTADKNPSTVRISVKRQR